MNMIWKGSVKSLKDLPRPAAEGECRFVEEASFACGYKQGSCQPLWAKDNMSKGAYYV